MTFHEKVGEPIKMDTVDPRAGRCPGCGQPGHLIGDNTALCTDHGRYAVPNISWPNDAPLPVTIDERMDSLEHLVKRIAAHLGMDT